MSVICICIFKGITDKRALTLQHPFRHPGIAIPIDIDKHYRKRGWQKRYMYSDH